MATCPCSDTKPLPFAHYRGHSVIPAQAGNQGWRGRSVATIRFLPTPVSPPPPVRSFPFPGIAGCTPPAVFVCAWGSALPPAGAAAVFPGSPGAGPPSQPPVRPRARLPSFPGVRSGRLFQPLSRSSRPFGPPGAGKRLSGVPGAAQGHPERGLFPCRRRGLASGSSCGWRPSCGLPPLFGSSEARRAVFSSPAGPKGCWGLESPHGGVLGPPRGIRSGGCPLPQARSASESSCGRRPSRGSPPFWLSEARRAVLSPRAVWKAVPAA